MEYSFIQVVRRVFQDCGNTFRAAINCVKTCKAQTERCIQNTQFKRKNVHEPV